MSRRCNTRADGLTWLQVGLLDRLDGKTSLVGVLRAVGEDWQGYHDGYRTAMSLQEDVLAGHHMDNLMELNCYLDFVNAEKEE